MTTVHKIIGEPSSIMITLKTYHCDGTVTSKDFTDLNSTVVDKDPVLARLVAERLMDDGVHHIECYDRAGVMISYYRITDV